jgi:HlyD family secretion protein
MSPEKRSLDDLKIDRNARPESAGFRWIWLVVAALGILAGIFWFAGNPTAAEVRTFTVREVAGGEVGTVLNASGYVTPRRQATVSAKVTGKVTEVLVEEGMEVEAGQVLARLDASNVLAQFQLAEAQWAAAQSGLRETEIRLDEAGRELRRISGLASEQISSPADLDRAQAEVNSLEARLDRQRLEIKVAQRQLALWEQQMEDTIIRAPFSGVVVSKDAQPGEMISPISAGGGFTRTGICTLVDMESLEIEVDVNESYINRIKQGQPVEAALDAYPNWKMPAKVIAIIPTADRQKATVRVRVGFEELDSRILPQMGVKVGFRSSDKAGEEKERGTPIPKSAVHQENGRDWVWVVRNGKVDRREVKVGSARNQEIFVLAGLSGGEKVVVNGGKDLANGSKVKEVK